MDELNKETVQTDMKDFIATAIQKIKVQILFRYLSFVPLSIGMVTATITGTWWLLIIMAGAFGLNIVSQLWILQPYVTFVQTDTKDFVEAIRVINKINQAMYKRMAEIPENVER